MAPKACGHTQGRRVVGRGEALVRVRAAVDARDEGADILVAARTDARQAESLEVRATPEGRKQGMVACANR